MTSLTPHPYRGLEIVYECVYVCVCVRERERERESACANLGMDGWNSLFKPLTRKVCWWFGPSLMLFLSTIIRSTRNSRSRHQICKVQGRAEVGGKEGRLPHAPTLHPTPLEYTHTRNPPRKMTTVAIFHVQEKALQKKFWQMKNFFVFLKFKKIKKILFQEKATKGWFLFLWRRFLRSRLFMSETEGDTIAAAADGQTGKTLSRLAEI